MVEDIVEIVLRDYDPKTDENYIYASWNRNSFFSAYPPKVQHNATDEETTRLSNIYCHNNNRFIENILKTAKVRIACIKESPIVIIGYSVCRNSHLDWVYVKDKYRRIGIGRQLMPNPLETVSNQLTKTGKLLVELKNLKVKGE